MVVLARIIHFSHRRTDRFHPGFPNRPGPQGNGEFRDFRGRPQMYGILPVHPPRGEVPPDLWRIHISISEPNADKLREYSWRGHGSNEDRPEVLVTVREGGVVYTNVSMHLKGSAGSFRPFDDKPCVTLNFSKHAAGQKFHGYSKLSLNNSKQDPSLLSEAICREMFDAAGIPVPRSGHATLLINERDLGLYVYTEGFAKPFLKRYFDDVRGNLYDGGFVQEIHTGLQVNSGDNPKDHTDLKRLISAASESDPSERWNRLGEILDLDRFITFIAMEIITCDWDGYAMNRNNTRIFHDLKADKMIFIPHGMDQMFGVFRSTPSSPILPDMRGKVARAVISVPEGRRMYLQKMAFLRTNVLRVDFLTNRIHELSRTIRPTIAAYDESWASSHDEQVKYLCRRIALRARSVSEQLGTPAEPLKFEQEAALLKGWEPENKSPEDGNVQFDKTQAGGSPMLHIKIDDAGTGSWRTRAMLPPGRFHFEGKAKLAETAGGAAILLRISGETPSPPRIRAGEWTSLRYAIPEGKRDITLVCELKTTSGPAEAWFDPGSLVIVRDD